MKKDLIKEARRYVDNAKKVLAENGCYNQELNLYEDEKYVRAAGHYLWHAVLMALDAVFHVRADRRTRVHIDDYLEVVNKRDGKLAKLVNTAYQIMHLTMDYDGNPEKNVCVAGFRLANDVIDRCEKMLPKSAVLS
ncbi:MAG: DUF5618 family protein [Bacteroidales bacterium]|nr:DUF5618 family protein [Bacteroidales bacterium]